MAEKNKKNNKNPKKPTTKNRAWLNKVTGKKSHGKAQMPKYPTKKKQTILGVITGKRGKKVSPHKGGKCASGKIWNQKLKKCVSQSGPAREAHKKHRGRVLRKTERRRMELGVHQLTK
tara:strand:- start:1575 stop:1928 length:354 start_codon:yes stop_codon:yes gene_type:complete